MSRVSALSFAIVLACAAAATTSGTAATQPDALIGRWDMEIAGPDGSLPGWLEVRRSGHSTLVGQLVAVVGSARPIAEIVMTDDRFHFSIPPQWEQGPSDLSVDGRIAGNGLAGTIAFPDGMRREWTAVRAPSLRRASAPVWGEPIRLFDGTSLSGWRVLGGENQWRAENGVLRNVASGGNLVTEREFDDFKLHVEFRYPAGGNSGVYLRGRHEVQIQDDAGKEPASDRFSGVYGFIAPSRMAARPAGEWQTYDITLVGRMITVVANGDTVICDREIPGITGGALDSNEGEPGPLMLQGDHGPVEYRNIVLTPAR